MKRVKQEHKQMEVEKLQVLLNAVGFNFDYQSTDLIFRTLKINSSKATIKDCVAIRQQWQKHYENQELYTEI
tara:strand:+ start:668 stop:883 length:216 start_codon:yes stop_codon:yes gene_type:complete